MPAGPTVLVDTALYDKEHIVARAIHPVLIRACGDFDRAARPGPTEDVHSHPGQGPRENPPDAGRSRTVSHPLSACGLSCR
jgi:hypothetical protein